MLKNLITKTMLTALLVSALVSVPAIPVNAQMKMEDDPVLTSVIIHQLEIRDSGADETFVWDAQGWIGTDLNKLWVKTEGERKAGTTNEFEWQALYSKAVAPFWDLQFGLRHDFRPTPTRDWAVIGLQGLAPYFFEIDAGLFIGEAGRTALRLEAEYELLLTQRWILTPDIEINLHGRNDEETAVGSGLSELELGLRLRYEFSRKFAPYVGINWFKNYGNTADFVRRAGDDTEATEFVIGVRAWF